MPAPEEWQAGRQAGMRARRHLADKGRHGGQVGQWTVQKGCLADNSTRSLWEAKESGGELGIFIHATDEAVFLVI